MIDKDQIEWMMENIYDPWTENVSVRRIKEDIKENPEVIIYGLIERCRELERDFDEYTEEREILKTYDVAFEKYGHVKIIAHTENEAWEKAKEIKNENEITWEDGFVPTVITKTTEV